MARPEAQLQEAVADYLRVALQPPTVWTAIAHGVWFGWDREKAQRLGGRLKAAGLNKGWPDLLVMHPSSNGGPIVLGLELKSKAGSLTPEQRELMGSFVALRAHFVLCRSVEEVQAALEFCRIPIRAGVVRKLFPGGDAA